VWLSFKSLWLHVDKLPQVTKLDTNIAQRGMEAISGNEEIQAKEAETKPFQFKPLARKVA